VKRVPCRVLEARMSPVMDGRDVSRGHCFTNGNPELQPSSLPWMMPHHQYMPRSALKHTLPHRHPMSVTS
jgi:hypothetical protein